MTQSLAAWSARPSLIHNTILIDWHLQPVQNAAAHLLTGTQRCDHITPILQQRHCLPVWQRVEFKLTVLVYKALNNLAPPYLSDNCQLVATTGRRQLRSSDNFKCAVISTSSHLGDRAFATTGPCLWNTLLTRLLAWFILGHLLSETENIFNWLRHQCLVTVAFRRCV